MTCNECKFAALCRIPEEKRAECSLKTDSGFDNTRYIFGRTEDEIAKMQGLKRLKK